MRDLGRFCFDLVVLTIVLICIGLMAICKLGCRLFTLRVLRNCIIALAFGVLYALVVTL